MGAPANPVALTGLDQQVAAGPGALYAGFTIRETASAAAVVRVFDGTSSSGVLIDEISLAGDDSARAFYADGIRCSGGVFVEVVSGDIAGSVLII